MSLPRRARAPYLHWLLLILLAVGTSFGVQRAPALAHEGHDHGPPAGSETGAPASPRVVAVSERYQFVGIVEGEVLVIYLDGAADNAPVTTATLEVTLDGQPNMAELQKNGSYELTSARLKTPGSIEVLVTLTEGAVSDLLAGALVIPGDAKDGSPAKPGLLTALKGMLAGGGAPTDAQTSGSPGAPRSKWPVALAAGGALLAALFIGMLSRRRKLVSVVAGLGIVLLAATAALANDGHDHGPDKSASNGNIPSRRADGTIFLPKPSQRLLEVRTRVLSQETASKTVRLTGRVVANPNFSGVVQGTIPGRYQAPEGGVPALGTRIKAGDLLGRVLPSFTSIDSSDMAQTLGDLEQKISIAQAKLARQEQLLRTNVVARAAIDETRLEVDGLVKRKTKILEARVRPEELRAPVDGVIAVARVVSGQVIAQTDRIFEIIDPARLLVEALVFDQMNPDAVTEATASVGSESVKLRFLGRSRALQQQYSLIQFEIVESVLALNVGMPVTVVARTGTPVAGLFVPRSALAQAPNGQMVLFEHREPEVFVPRAVKSEPFDSQTVRITGGIEAGAKIVVRNAPLVSQVR